MNEVYNKLFQRLRVIICTTGISEQEQKTLFRRLTNSGYHASLENKVKAQHGVDTGNVLEVLETDPLKGAANNIIGNDESEANQNESPEEENDDEAPPEEDEGEVTTIKSVFVKMKPSEHRYTILEKLRDEL